MNGRDHVNVSSIGSLDVKIIKYAWLDLLFMWFSKKKKKKFLFMWKEITNNIGSGEYLINSYLHEQYYLLSQFLNNIV